MKMTQKTLYIQTRVMLIFEVQNTQTKVNAPVVLSSKKTHDQEERYTS